MCVQLLHTIDHVDNDNDNDNDNGNNNDNTYRLSWEKPASVDVPQNRLGVLKGVTVVFLS